MPIQINENKIAITNEVIDVNWINGNIYNQLKRNLAIDEFTFSNCKFDNDSFAILLNELLIDRKIKKLQFDNNNLTHPQLERLEKFLANKPNLASTGITINQDKLEINAREITSKGIEKVLKKIVGNQDSFVFNNCAFLEDSLEKLLAFLKVREKIDTLSFNNNHFTPYQLAEIGNYIETHRAGYRYFSLEGEDISQNPILVTQLAHKHLPQMVLDSAVNPDSFGEFAAAFRNSKTKMLTVYKVNDDLIGPIADLLSSNHLRMLTIRSVEEAQQEGQAAAVGNIKYSKLSIDGIKQFAQALEINRSLRDLDLGCTIEPEGLKLILAAAKLNPYLQTFTYAINETDPVVRQNVEQIVAAIKEQVEINYIEQALQDAKDEEVKAAEQERQEGKPGFNIDQVRKAKLAKAKADAKAAVIKIEKRAQDLANEKAKKEAMVKAAEARQAEAREAKRKELAEKEEKLKQKARDEEAKKAQREKEEMERRAREEAERKIREAEEQARREAEEKARKAAELEKLKHDIEAKLVEIKAALVVLNECLVKIGPLSHEFVVQSKTAFELSDKLDAAKVEEEVGEAAVKHIQKILDEYLNEQEARSKDLEAKKQTAKVLNTELGKLKLAEAQKKAEVEAQTRLLENNMNEKLKINKDLEAHTKSAEATAKKLATLKTEVSAKETEGKAAEAELANYLTTKQEASKIVAANTTKAATVAKELSELRTKEAQKTQEVKDAAQLVDENVAEQNTISLRLDQHKLDVAESAKKSADLKASVAAKMVDIKAAQDLVDTNLVKQGTLAATLVQIRGEATDLDTKLGATRGQDTDKKSEIADVKKLLRENTDEQGRINGEIARLTKLKTDDEVLLADYEERLKSDNKKDLETLKSDMQIVATARGWSLFASISKWFSNLTKKGSTKESSTSKATASAEVKDTKAASTEDATVKAIREGLRLGMNKIDESIKEYTVQLAAQGTALTDAQNAALKLQETLDALVIQEKEIEGNITALMQEKGQKEQQVKEQQDLLDAARAEEVTFKGKVKELDREKAQIETEVAATDKATAALEVIVQQDEQDLRASEAKAPALAQKVKDLSAEHTSITEAIATAEKEHATLSGSVAAKTGALTAEAAQEKALTEKAAALKQAAEGLKTDVLRTEHEDTNAKKAIKDTTQLLDDNKKEYALLLAKVKNLDQAHKSASDEVHEAEQGIQVLDTEITEEHTNLAHRATTMEPAIREDLRKWTENRDKAHADVVDLEGQTVKAEEVASQAMSAAARNGESTAKNTATLFGLYQEQLEHEKHLKIFTHEVGEEFIADVHNKGVEAMGGWEIKFVPDHI